MANLENFAKGRAFALWFKSAILSTLLKNYHFSASAEHLLEILVLLETGINSVSRSASLVSYHFISSGPS